MQILSLSKMCGFEIRSLSDVFGNAAHSAVRLETVQGGWRGLKMDSLVLL